MSDRVPEELNNIPWVSRMQVAHGLGILDGEDGPAPSVGLVLWCLDMPTPFPFSMAPASAREIAAALVYSADQAEARYGK